MPTRLAVHVPTRREGDVVHVKVTNPGTTPEAYFVDARLNQSVQLSLVSSTGSAVTVPVPSTTVPQYLVPSHTTSITAAASAKRPIFFDYSWAFGDPDLISSSAPFGDSASGSYSAAFIAPGDWIITPFQDGPDGVKGSPPVKAETSLPPSPPHSTRPSRRQPATCGWPVPTFPHRSRPLSSTQVRRPTFQSQSRRRARSGAR